MRTSINKKSDFDFIVLDSEGNAIDMPTSDFTLDLWTWGSKCRFRASSIGGVLKGCKNDGGKLRVYVDNPGFVPGKLVGEWVSYVSSEEYPDGTQRTCRYISDFGIDMVDGDSTTNEQQVLAMMQYIQGASAYEIACEYGFDGTEQEWLDSLALPANEAAAECKALMTELSNAEAERETAEQQRVQAENDRALAEVERAGAEQRRKYYESARQDNETKRKDAEEYRIRHENGRDAMEDLRVKAENERVDAENLRNTAEDARIANEATRQTNEQARETAEVSRAAAEEERKRTHDRLKTAMREYADAESLREESEAERREAEQYRIEYEQSRQSSESTRATNERNRVTTEQQRVTNETARSNAENSRATAETARQSAETARQAAEQGRVTAEQQRADAEAARAEEFAGFEGKIAAKEDAANKVTSIGADANNTTFPTTRAVLNSIAEVKNIEVTPEMLSESTKQYINASGGGTITNLADDEDLTSVDNVLKLADKDYSPTSYSGMGRVYLRKNMVDSKNILTQEMMTKENTIYIIQYDYDLNGATINVPANCTLDFQGGSLANGTVMCNATYINGSIGCIENLTKLGGTLVNAIMLSWIGVHGNYNNNAANLKKWAAYNCKQYMLDSNITVAVGDIEMPKNISLYGSNFSIKFTCADAENGLLLLNNNKIQDVSIEFTNKDYSKAIIVADTELNDVHSFDLYNVKILGSWNEEKVYNSTAIKISCSNENKPNGNHISNCNLNNINISWVKNGIEIICRNFPYDTSNYFAWLNEIHISNIYVSSTENGLYTSFIDNGVSNRANSVGPIYLNNFEYQALNRDSLMFSHNGAWTLFINTGLCYDSQYKGIITGGGKVYSHNLEGCYVQDTNGDGAEFKVVDSVKVYKGEYHKNSMSVATASSFRDNIYFEGDGTQTWNIGCVENNRNFYISQGGKYIKEILFNNGHNNRCSKGYCTSGPKYTETFAGGKPGLMHTLCAKNYGIDENVSVLELHRVTHPLEIINSYGTVEVYNGGFSQMVSVGTVIEAKINLKFKIDGIEVGYDTYKNKYNAIAANASPNVRMYGFSVIDSHYVIESGKLYIYVKAKKYNPTTWVGYCFDIMYSRGTKSYTIKNDEIFLDDFTNERFISSFNFEFIRMYKENGATDTRPTLLSSDKGFQFFDTTLNKPIWWTGSAWVDATGAEA